MLVPPSPLEWLSVAQVAEELQLSQQQIKQYIARGDLPATKDLNKRGTPWLVERQMLERWITEQYAQTDDWRRTNPRGGDVMWDRVTGGHR